MLTYLFIAFVIMVALAPLTHFIPSKRQRAVAGMREYAAVQGLFVELRKPPLAPGMAPPEGEVIYYGCRLPLTRKQEVVSCQWLCEGGQWRSFDRRSKVPAVLETMPPTVFAASRDQGSCGVYWVEAGGEETVAQICRGLQDWVLPGT